MSLAFRASRSAAIAGGVGGVILLAVPVLLPADRLPLLTAAIAAAGFTMTTLQLKAEYRWRRKQLAVQMLAEWNRNTAEHRLGLDRVYPGVLDGTGPASGAWPTLDDAEAARLHEAEPKRAQPDQPDLIAVRGHIMQLLNYAEYVAVAAQQGAADPDVIAGSFDGALHRMYHALYPYMRHVTEHRRRNPWQPFEDYARGVCEARTPPCPMSGGPSCIEDVEAPVSDAAAERRTARGR
jgi:hypothetical protein